MNMWFKVLPLIFTILLLIGCDDKTGSPEDEIRQFIQQGVEAAEARKAGDLKTMLNEDYRDQQGNDKARITSLMRALFFRHKNIHLFTKIDEIHFPTSENASVSLFVAMTGSVVTDVSMLSGLRAQIYRFELELIKNDDQWLLRNANWRRASARDIGNS